MDSTGAVENHLTYDAFGNVTSETDDTVDHVCAYTGRDRDEESDLQYNRARYYDAGVGRWISEDPIGFLAGDSNLARYVGNFSTGARDPSGLVAISGVATQGDRYEELPPNEGIPAGPREIYMDDCHMWIEADIYNTHGQKIGRREFHFSKESLSPSKTNQYYKTNPRSTKPKPLRSYPSTREQDMELDRLWGKLETERHYNARLRFQPTQCCWTTTHWWERYGGSGGDLPPANPLGDDFWDPDKNPGLPGRKPKF